MNNTELTSQNTVVWHGRNTAEHKTLVDKWAALGFRTTSLAIYGDPSNPLYAAVMVKRASIHAESQVFPRTQAALQNDFDKFAKQGRGPYILTAVGPANAPTFAASFRPMSSIPFTRLNLSRQEFSVHNAERHAAGEILIWVDVFGDAGNPRFAAIWGLDPGDQAWSIDGYDPGVGAQEFLLGPALLQQRFEAVISSGGRPSHIAMTPSGAALELIVDSTIGTWTSRSGLTADEYQDEYTKQTKAGRQPLRVSAKGPGSSARFAAIFASREGADTRSFRSKGPVTIPEIDKVMQDCMNTENLRGLALAITRGTQLVYAKGYTFAEAGYPDITPETLFRQASVSKTFTGVAMMRFMQLNPSITPDTTVQSIMNLRQPNGSAPADPRWADIRIRHLLESDSGIDQGLLFGSYAAAKALGAALPATPIQLLSYATMLKLTGKPGDKNNSVYGNFDYFLLGQIIAKLVGVETFDQALSQLLLEPLHLTHTRGSRSLITDQLQGEARYHMALYNPNGWSAFEVLPTVRAPGGKLVPTHYGALDFEMFSAAGGISSSVVDVARLGAMFSGRLANPLLSAETLDSMLTACAAAGTALKGPKGEQSHGYYGLDSASVDDPTNHVFTAHKGGWLPGSGTMLQFTTGGFTYAIADNGNGKNIGFDWVSPIEKIFRSHSWSNEDLFATAFGMPSLAPQAKLVLNVPKVRMPIAETRAQIKAAMSRGWAGRPRD